MSRSEESDQRSGDWTSERGAQLDSSSEESVRYPVAKNDRQGSITRPYVTIVLCLVLALSPLLLITGSVMPVTNEDSASTVPLASTLTQSGVSLTASPSSAYVGDEITFFANATSDVGANLTFTIYYDYLIKPYPTVNPYSAFTVNTTTSPGSVVTKHTYNTVGNYSVGGRYFFWVYMFVNDTLENSTTILQVRVNYNAQPVLWSPPDNPTLAVAGVEKNISILISDADSDLVTVHWDFGDGTNSTNVTVAPPFPPGVLVNVTHTWNPRIPGYGPYNATYLLNVSISDGTNAPVNFSGLVKVSVGVNWPPILKIKASQTLAVIDALNPTATIGFSANASDLEGDPLTWTFNYSDGSPLEVYQYTAWTTPSQLMWQNTTHVFSAVGNYTVKISVTDALVPNQVGYHNVTDSVTIRLILNVPPYLGTLTLGTNPLINGTIGYVDVKVSVDAVDDDGDVLTLTWSLNGVVIDTNVSAGTKDVYTFLQVIRFNDTGFYNISVVLTDGRPGHEMSTYRVFEVTSNNRPPDVVQFTHTAYTAGDFALPNETLEFTFVLTDPERDVIEASVDFGDNSPRIFLNLTNYDASGNVTFFLNHSYSAFGNYTVRINITDNKIGLLNHTKTYALPIRVWVKPPPEVVIWDWWDFTSLGLVLMIPVGSILWFFRLRAQRKRIEDQGMTYEEWKLKSQIKSQESKELRDSEKK